MSGNKRHGSRDDFVKRYRRIAAEFRQIYVDANAWNNLHPNDPPLDAGNDLVRANAAEMIARAIQRGYKIPAEAMRTLTAPVLG